MKHTSMTVMALAMLLVAVGAQAAISPAATVDLTTKGSWVGVYGSQGYILGSFDGGGGAVGTDRASLPGSGHIGSYSSTLGRWKWATASTDVRAMEDPANTNSRSAGCWYTAGTATITLNPNRNGTFNLGLYFLDWDQTNRACTLTISGAGLTGTESVSNYNAGKWYVYPVTATTGTPMVISIAYVSGSGAPNNNTVISAVTFDPSSVGTPPVVTNIAAQNILAASADIVGTLASTGASPTSVSLYWATNDCTTNAVAWLNGGSVTNLGYCTAGTTFTNTLSGLNSNTLYYFNHMASNAYVTAWAATNGSPFFRTQGATPGVNNGMGPSAVAFTTATVNGNLVGGGQAQLWIDWGTDTNNWSNTIDLGVRPEGIFSANLTGLIQNTYHYQCRASNAYGMAWSAVTNFTTFASGAYYVTPTGAGAMNGPNWANAYSNIQSALDACANNGTIYLKTGSYPLGAQLSLSNRTGVTVLGGYVGSGSPGALSGTNSTIYGNASNVRILSVAAAPNTTLQRLTLTGGAVAPPAGGAGIYVSNCPGFAVWDCTISSNITSAGGNDVNVYGGGVYANASDVTLSNCVVCGNQASVSPPGARASCFGGGIYVNSGTCRVTRSELRGNVAACTATYGSRGGAICLNAGLLDVRNSLIAANDAAGGFGYGDGVDVVNGTATLSLCTIVNNGGSGVQREAGTLAVTNSILWGNVVDAAGTLTLAYCDVQACGAGVTRNGCLSADPLFERGLYLPIGSPCVNAGNDTAANLGVDGLTTRADGTTDTGTVDLGYHFAAGNNMSVADLYVTPSPGGSDTTGNGTPGAPFATITKALSLAQAGTRVHVAAGTYTKTTETMPLTLAKDGVQVLGTNAALTQLSGGGSVLVLQVLNSCGDTRVEGMTIANGFQAAVGNGSVSGGGIYASLSALTMASCTIVSNKIYAGYNYGYDYGAGVYLYGCLATVTNCLIKQNDATPHGGGKSCSFGGGLAALGGRCDIVDSVIAQNITAGDLPNFYYDHGGGLYLGAGVYSVRNCLVATNSAQFDSDGIYVAAGGSAQFRNVTVANNLGEGLHSTGTVTLTSSILWNNGTDVVADVTGAVTLAWSDAGVMSPLVATNAGCCSADPLFVNTAAGDYHEQSLGGSWHGGLWLSDAAMSPCIDAGDPSDPRGALEPPPNFRNLINMGAYGGTAQASKSRPAGGLMLMVE